MYTARTRGTSLLLALATVLSLIFAGGGTLIAEAARDDYMEAPVSWTIISENDGKTDEARFWELDEALSTANDKKYVRLGADIDVTFDFAEDEKLYSESRIAIHIAGTKYLDLNGHTLKVRYNDDDTYESNSLHDTSRCYLFYVEKGDCFTVCDSKGGGKIQYDSKTYGGRSEYSDSIKGYHVGPTRNIFWLSGGTLAVNGGEITAGSTYRRYVTYATNYDDFWADKNTHHTGYTYDTVNGSAVIISSGTFIMNGGKLTGHGHRTVPKNSGFFSRAYYDKPSSTVEFYTGSGRAVINAGQIIGDVESSPIGLKYDLKADTAIDLTVNGGYFEAKGCREYIGKGYNGDTIYKPVKYGSLDAVSAHIKSDGRSVIKTGEHSVGVSPKTPTGADNKYFTLTKPSSSTYSPDNAAAKDLGVQITDNYVPYYTAGDSYYYWFAKKGGDSHSGSGYQITANFAIYDSDGKVISSRINQWPGVTGWGDKVRISSFLNKDAGKLQLEEGKTYRLRCTITEQFIVDRNGKASDCTAAVFSVYDEWVFRVDSVDTANVTLTVDVRQRESEIGSTAEFVVTPTLCGYITDSRGVQHDVAADSRISDRSTTYGYVENGEYKQIASGKDSGVVSGLPEGKCTLYCKYSLKYNGMPYEFNAVKSVYVFSRIAAGKSSDKAALQDNDTYTTTEDIVLSPYTTSSAPAGLNASDIAWQYKISENAWAVITPEAAGRQPKETDLSGVKINTTSARLVTDRSGVYRAVLTTDDGVDCFSPVPFTVAGNSYTSDCSVNISANSGTGSYTGAKGGCILTVSYNASGTGAADWSEIIKGTYTNRAQIVLLKQDYTTENWAKITQRGTTSKGEHIVATIDWPGETNKSGHLQFSDGSAKLDLWGFFSVRDCDPGVYCFYAKIPATTTGSYIYCKTPVRVTYCKTITGADICVEGVNITNSTDAANTLPGTTADNAPTYRMPANTEKINLSAAKLPANANYPPVSCTWSIVSAVGGEADTIAKLSSDSGSKCTLSACAPGTVTVRLNVKGTDEEIVRYIKVVVPIAGFVTEAPDMEGYVGEAYSAVQLPVTYVFSSCGELISNTDNDYIEATVSGLNGVVNCSGATSKEITDTVEYNDSGKVGFVIAAKAPYELCVYNPASSKDYYEADWENIRANSPNNARSCEDITEPDCLPPADTEGYTKTGEWNASTGQMPQDAKLHCTYDMGCIEDPGAVYLDVINITTAEPHVGDPLWAGELTLGSNGYPTSWDMLAVSTDNEDDAEVLTFDSRISVIKSSLRDNDTTYTLSGSGTTYEPVAPADHSEALYSDYRSDSLVYGKNEAQIRAIKYESGYYEHELTISAGNTGADGKKYYISPDVELYVNGSPVQLKVPGNYGELTSGYRNSGKIETAYYVQVVSGDEYTAAVIDVPTPAAGNIPATLDEVKVTSITKSDGTVIASPGNVYVKDMYWFCDDIAKDGQLTEITEGVNVSRTERCYPGNYLDSAGQFMPGREYYLYAALGITGTDGYFNSTAFSLTTSDGAKASSAAAYGVIKFDATEHTGTDVSFTVTSCSEGSIAAYLYPENAAISGKAITGTVLYRGGSTEAAKKSSFEYTSTVNIYNVEKGKKYILCLRSADCETYIRGTVETTATGGYTIKNGGKALADAPIALYRTGDADFGGYVDTNDPAQLLRYINGVNVAQKPVPKSGTYQFDVCDVNADGTLDVGDVQALYARTQVSTADGTAD